MAGFIYLLMGADLLVRGAVALAHRARISPTLVAATIVALGTSLPELVVAVRATLTDHPAIVLGNVVGSNTANVLLVVGTAAVVAPLSLDGSGLRRDGLWMLGVSLVFVVICLTSGLTPLAGVLLLAGFIAVWGIAARETVRERSARRDEPDVKWVLGLPRRLPMIALFVVFGLIGLPLGARLVVEASVEIAERLGIAEAVVGLTIIAFSTSLPELATSVVAAYQRRYEVAVAGVLGSNTLNLLGIMGVSAVMSGSPIRISPAIRNLDLPIMVGSTVMLTAFVVSGRPIGRMSGIVWVAVYAGYVALCFLGR